MDLTHQKKDASKSLQKMYRIIFRQKKWDDYERAVNRVRYEFSKLDGAKPRYNRGKYVKNWYTCRNCGCIVKIEHNYCPNCGYKLLWDEIRCLTDMKED